MFIRQTNRFAMTTRQLFGFPPTSAAIDGPNRVEHVFCSKISAGGDDSFSRRQATNLTHDLPAFGENGRPADSMNGAIHAASAQ